MNKYHLQGARSANQTLDAYFSAYEDFHAKPIGDLRFLDLDFLFLVITQFLWEKVIIYL